MSNQSNRFDAIYNVVFQIPFGRVATYGQIGQMSDPPCDPRMVGWALASLGNRREELPVPWQRVVAKGGRLTLPGENQRQRLEDEGVEFRIDGTVDMEKYGWSPG